MMNEHGLPGPEHPMPAWEHEPAGSAPEPAGQPETDGTAPEKESARELYDLAKAVDNDLVKKYQPKFLARGGEHIIYEIPGHPDIVVKVEAAVMAKIQNHNAEHGLPLDAMDPDVLPHAQEVVRANQERYKQMKKHFGSEHILGMKQSLVKIPVTESIVNQLHSEPIAGAKEAKESWAIVRVQKRAPEFADPDRQTVVAGYMENRNPNPEIYARVTRALAEGDPNADYTPEEFRALLPKQFKGLLEKADGDEQLSAVLRDFVEKTMAYVEDTGELLDLAGDDNVTVFQKDGKWNYRLVDALYPTGASPYPKRMLDTARESVAAAARGEDAGQKNLVYNTINFLRVLNGMARQFGVGRQISIAAEADRGKVDYLKFLEGEYKKGIRL
jgi:hypothetical protein